MKNKAHRKIWKSWVTGLFLLQKTRWLSMYKLPVLTYNLIGIQTWQPLHMEFSNKATEWIKNRWLSSRKTALKRGFHENVMCSLAAVKFSTTIKSKWMRATIPEPFLDYPHISSLCWIEKKKHSKASYQYMKAKQGTEIDMNKEWKRRMSIIYWKYFDLVISKVFLEENAKLLQILEQGASRKLELDINGLTLKGPTIIGLSQKKKCWFKEAILGYIYCSILL